jgi:hypothetical protein
MAADAPNAIAEVDAASHKDLVAAIAASLAETYSKNGKSTLLKKPAAVRLGPHFGVTWAAPATTTVDGMKESIDRTSYAVVFGGRMYSVEIRAPKGKLDEILSCPCISPDSASWKLAATGEWSSAHVQAASPWGRDSILSFPRGDEILSCPCISPDSASWKLAATGE